MLPIVAGLPGLASLAANDVLRAPSLSHLDEILLSAMWASAQLRKCPPSSGFSKLSDLALAV